MQKNSRPSPSHSTRRSVAWGSAIVASAVLLSAAGCRSQDPVAPEDVSGFSGSGTATGAGSGGRTGSSGASASAGKASTTGGAPATGGGSGTGGSAVTSGGTGTGGDVVGSGGMGTGGDVVGSGGMSAGGMSTGGMSTGGMSTGGMSTGGMSEAGKPCVDVEPPPDPEWPGAVCENWALETTECGEAWFAGYCDVSCGRCVPEGGGGLPMPPDCSGENLPNVTGGDGFATRYWDCCQTHCSQSSGHRCNQDGTSITGSTQSACSGGNSFACYDEAPRAVSTCLSYGHIAKANPNCGGCYRIQFTGQGEHNANDVGSKLIQGKQMIVKVTNTGGDVAGNQFDLMIPGGGVGMFNACSTQWGTNDLGAQYGGFLSECTGAHSAKKECVRQECMKIPAGKAREGCLWFVDWFEVADNPKFTSQQTNCPF
jgi:hypothetical protein